MDDFKLKQMNASATMFRRTLGGTPAGSGDDMYNDRIDNINIGEQNLVEIGKDEAGNPIMGNPLNVIVETAPPTKAETQGPLANAADFLNKVGESMFLDENGKTKSATDIAGSVFDSTALGSAATQAAEAGNYLYNFATATPEQQRAMALPNLAKAGLKEQIHKLPNATELEHSQLYENFYYGANSAQHNAEVKRIADTIGVREEVFANDPELYKNASLMAERIERMKKSKKYQDKDGNINMQKIYDDIPGLSKVQKEKGTAAAALVLANLEGMQTIGNVYKNNTAGQFFGSVGAGLSKEIGSIRKIWNWLGPTYGARLPNAEERTALAEVDANMRAIPKYSYNTTAQTIGAMLGGFLENAHYMGSSIIPRAAIALATRGKGGTITQKAGDVLSVATMAAITAPLQYEELINSVDENGNQKYTPQQARAIAIAQAIPQAILEDYSLRQIGGAIFGKSAAPALRDIITKSAGLEAMKAGVADYIKFKVRDAVKAGTISYGSEFAEEFEQGISDRVVENLAQIFISGEDADVQSIESILYGAAGDTIEAWNAIAGFGVAGLLLNPIANTRAVLNFRNHVRMATTDKMVQGMTANAHYGSVLSGVWENKKQIKELHDKAPDVEQTILDAHNKEAGIEYGFVNIRELRKTENGEKIVQDIAQRNNVSDEELAACLDGSGMLRVKTSTLMQMEVNETQQNSIKENVTTELGTFTPAQQKAFFEVLESQMKGMKDFSDKTYKEAVDNIIKARFPDAEQAKLAREIIEANYDNPLAEFRRRLNSINTELWEEVEAYVPQLREALKENGIKLNKGETFKDIAVKIASGQADERFDIPALASTLGEIRTGLAPSAEKLTQLVDAREKLLALRDRFSQLKPGEIVATATLSAEGLKVYDALNSMMSASQNENVRAAARANALMMARMADNMAKAYRAARNVENYTAEDYMREFFRLDVNAVYNEELADAAQLLQSVSAEPSMQRTEDLQEMADGVSTVELNAVSAKDPEAQAYMKEQMLKRGMSEEDADGLLAILDGITNDVLELARKYPAMLAWQEKGLDRVVDKASKLLVPKLSAFKKNGEYKINIDLGTLCMKREAADVLNQILISEGMGQQLGPSQLEALKDLLKSYNYLTACDVCFVEAKRVRMLADANKTSYDWKSTLLAAGITDNQVLGQERVLTKEQMERLKRMADPKTYKEAFEEYMPQDRRRTKTNGDKGADLDTGTTPDKMFKIAKLFTEDPSLAGELDPTILITTAGTDNLFRTYGAHTSIKSTIAGMYGSATSKPLEGFTLYDALSWRKSFDNAALDKNMEDVYAIGGGRAQSFTDFNPILFLDYVQMVADYEARNLPMHVYTKVPSFVQLFGETGIMINMSFVPEIVDGVDEAHAGLRWNEETKEWEYAWHEDSFPIDLAYELRQRKEYGGRVGIIAVGVSKEHIKKLMADPRIDMVIPYHASGMPHSVKLKTGLEIATDYTDVQTTKIPATAKEKIEKDTGWPAEEYLNYSRILREPEFKNPHDAAKEYLRRCDKYKCTPVFEEFRNEDGYFKVLEDFRGLDENGNGVAQGPVRLKLPDNWKEILDEALGDRGKQKAMLEDLKTNEEILSKARAILKAQRLDGEIREVMLKRLRSALGQQKMSTEEKNKLRAKYPKTWRKQRTSNVQSLKKSEFLDKLEEAYAKDMTTEEAKARVEVFRMNNGIVYGFAQNGQIFLNENAFNANTPAHEFTHIWAKVAQEKNPKLWAEGVKLLKSDAKEVWERVEKDPLYESIRGDENAVASEVLARLVGEQNEEFVRELMDPTQKMPKGKGLTKRIQEWLLKVFDEVRSLFDSVDGKPLTFDEFRRMPLKTLWDVNANKQFRRNSVKFLQDLQAQETVQADAIEMQASTLMQQADVAKGAISVNERNERLIQLFTEGADQSTFIHEMAHMFLMDLQNIAGIDPNSKQAKDLKTIMTWAEYKPGQAEEYKGTASYEEFKKREEAIKEAEAKGDTAEAQRLKGVWAQERFARAFEEYLRTGEAPARGLKKAFRDFKKWLTEIYNDVTGAGVRATPEVEAIMARIVASEEEIETLEAANNIARKITESNVMPENATELIKQWQEEAKEEAKEKLLKELVKQYYQKNLKNINEKLDEIRKNTRAELQQVPCFICEQLIKNGTSMESALEITGFANEQEYKDALEKAGGSLNNAVNAVVKAARENMIKQMPSNDELYNMAEDAINSGDYNARLSTLEADILKELKDEYNSLPAKLRRAFEEIDKHFGEEMSKETWAAFKRSIYRLKYAERWGAQEYILIKEFEDAVNKLEEPDRAAVEKLRQRYEKLKEQTIRNKQWINGIAGATDGKMKAIKQMAAERLGRESVSVATNARYWHRQALSAAKRAWDGLRKVNKGEQIDYDNAVAAKEEQAVYDAMTAQAIKNRQQLNRWMNGMNGFLARAKRMADPKFKADPNMRYYYSHLMYVFGIRNSDGIPPTDLKPITDVLADLRASHQFEDEVPEWLISAANATEQGKDYQQLTMGQLQELKKFTDILYTLARNQNQLLTMDVSMDDVVADCTVDYLNNVDYKVGHQKIGEVRGAIGDYMNGLLKPEVILSLLGGEKGGFIKYIYRILFDAAEAEEKAREAEAVAIRALYKAFYSKEALRAMLNDTVMTTDENGKQVPLTIGDDSNITKENLICMALNMGNSTNRARLCVGLFGVTNEQQLAMAEAEVTRILQENLTENDWKFVQAMWNHIDSFADPVSKVLEKSLGVPLDRVKREPFTVVFPDGRTMRMEGGYYPIVKDSSKSTRQTEFDQLEEAKAVGGVSVFGTGMSATKNRADNLFVDNGPLKLTLDVAHNHITAQIHLIHARMAVRDVYKVINNKAIQGMIRQTCGEGTVQSLNEWVLSCWAPPVRTRSWYENVVAKVRSKTVGAIMAYRASTALLNAANVVYMAQEIGVKNALIAMAEFYKHPSRNKQMILDVSVFMRNRASNIDRDLNAQQDSVLNRHEGVLGKLGNAVDKATGGRSEEMRYMIDKYANWMIETTDMMVSLPLYKWQFEQTYSEEIAKGVPEEEARDTANFEATRRVQKVFGSSREVDRSKVQREKNEMVKMLTPFFTFANTMFNAVWSKYYAGKFNGATRVQMTDDAGNLVFDAEGNPVYITFEHSVRKRYARFVRAFLFNFVLGALVETWLRQIPNWLAGSGDDDDDEDRIGVGVLSVNKKQWGKNVIDSAAAGFPLINIATENIVSALEGRRSGGRGVGVIAGSIGRWTTVANDIVKIAQGKDSVDAIDFMRDVVRVTNIRTGMSDTITDAVFNTVRFIGDDYQLDNMDDLREYIAKTIFDRKLKKK